ncbi:MAG: N(4)-(beta-N-acetylglucosaminyl)-L-asparaginase [Planctomycetales bacterium]|nr:N(4)-(beta-N-acetylglucosaminyl)-L-asparaginase [Planctomycetales bacterium]
MKFNRRNLGAAAAGVALAAVAGEANSQSSDAGSIPIVVSTWKHGVPANSAAWAVLKDGGRALDAVEAAARCSESDPDLLTVGLGGLPDRQGRVTLDACIMDENGACGSVACLEEIEHPISVARRVMEKTPHVMLVGPGALAFAEEQGFPRRSLLTDRSKVEWEKWKSAHPEAIREREVNVENHDTIGILAIDKNGNLSGACTTSGMAWKLPGRVGDSPIIGAGLYVDNEVGGAVATGVGEAVIRAVGSFLVVELMRQGHTPGEACRLAVERVAAKSPDWRSLQVGFLALDKQGRWGAYALQPGFDFAVHDGAEGSRMVDSPNKLASSENASH